MFYFIDHKFIIFVHFVKQKKIINKLKLQFEKEIKLKTCTK